MTSRTPSWNSHRVIINRANFNVRTFSSFEEVKLKKTQKLVASLIKLVFFSKIKSTNFTINH